jgi:hypothetical protein
MVRSAAMVGAGTQSATDAHGAVELAERWESS